ncbi:ribonuclease Z [Bacillus alkalicellulosilyticus]|uniref:ribonuclease Z n=1 Tax=Alkalihalobacterium alkalicellulosilyticum TaxID=1912214 RepID=UPI0009984746|nr:ribonuclease Z [Bacillus alkalicellulosilyticus]
MEFHFFGTGAGIPSKDRNVSAMAIRFLQHNGMVWLFDCGEGTQHQFLHSSLTLSKIEKIFISHLHGDHIFGLPGLLGSRSFQGGRNPVTIYGPKGIQTFVETSLTTSQTRLLYDLSYHEVTDQEICVDGNISVQSFLLEHGLDSFGYRLTEVDKPGKLDVAKLREKGIPPGPLYERIKKGESITLDSGEVLESSCYVGQATKGRVVAIAGDTRETEKALSLARDADVLIHEATFRQGEEDQAYQFFHSTTKQAAQLAIQASVKYLLITHISSRYSKEESEIEKEIQTLFPSSFLAYDHAVFTCHEKNKILSKQPN